MAGEKTKPSPDSEQSMEQPPTPKRRRAGGEELQQVGDAVARQASHSTPASQGWEGKAGRRGGRPAVSIGTKLFTFGLSQSPVSEPTGPKSADLSASFAAATSPPAKPLNVCKTAGVVAESLCACLTGRLTAHGHAAAEVGADSDWRCAESTLNRTGAGTWRL
jgi:hypothetical protein